MTWWVVCDENENFRPEVYLEPCQTSKTELFAKSKGLLLLLTLYLKLEKNLRSCAKNLQSNLYQLKIIIIIIIIIIK